MPKLSIRDLDLQGQRVFIRVDFNVPLKDGRIGDDTRIRSSLPTIAYALEHGATVVLASHLGRPKGKPNPQMSLRPIADRLAELLGKPVVFATDCIGDVAKKAVDQVQASGGGVVLLENLRFHPDEETNTPTFAASLASLLLFVVAASQVARNQRGVPLRRIAPAAAARRAHLDPVARPQRVA